MDPHQSQETKTEQSRPITGTTSDFQVDAKLRGRFTNQPNKAVKFARTKQWFQRQRNGARFEDEEKQEMAQPRSSWMCFSPNIGTGSSPEQQQKAAARTKDSTSILPDSDQSAADDSVDEYGFSDDLSGIVSRDVTTFTTKTPVAHNRGKKLDLLQPIYERMGLYTKTEKNRLRDALADLLFIVR
ncbi:MAG: hypothetical protein SGBAC_010156 [Bacillariaceae sp.]